MAISSRRLRPALQVEWVAAFFARCWSRGWSGAPPRSTHGSASNQNRAFEVYATKSCAAIGNETTQRLF